MTSALLYVLLIFSYFNLRICTANDSITMAKSLRDGETIVSGDGTFKLAFFGPPNSTDRYVGIWYNKVSVMKVVWVANRNNPLNDSSGILKISEDGNLQVLNGQKEIIWRTNVTHRASNFSSAQLSDSGSLVLLSSYSTILWQSLDNPTNTFLPKMSVTFNKDTYKIPLLHSWRSPSDPSNGRFSLRLNSVDLPEFIFFDGDQPYWRSGPWNGFMFIGIQVDYPDLHSHALGFQNDGQGNITMVYSNSEFSLSNYELSYKGTAIHQYWDDGNGIWEVLWQNPDNECGFYGKCGEFGSCNHLQDPICRCLEGFLPKNKEEWDKGNWSSGCTRRTQLQCGIEGAKDDRFMRLKKMKVPAQSEWSAGLDEDGCRSHCLGNCSCSAYAYDIGVGCMSWSTNLIDTVEFSTSGVDLYLRLAASELSNNSKLKAIIAVTVVSGTATLLAVIYLVWNKKAKQGKKSENYKALLNMLGKSKAQFKIEELTFYEFKKLAIATNDFQQSNKLGEGGFGQVFWGKLADGQEIAVKRLSLTSRQGLEEFLNEAAVVSKLQHRNLVKLLGCCVEEEEKMLIYEYMPNKSLDAFLFDLQKQELLNWKKRFIIIRGICKGLLYLHRDSRLRIIHRDLKVSNILLDEDLNPKIADFGMARIFGGSQDQAKTKRLVGTYGYMSPEYAMEGRFSEKSDVFSFGVLLLEIISGKRNNRFWDEEQSSNLLGYAWKLWNQGNIVLLTDSVIYDPCFSDEIIRCIQVALLCVQEFPKDRPDITMVISMIQSEIANLPSPKQPGFTHSHSHSDQGSSQQGQESGSSNNVSITTISAR